MLGLARLNTLLLSIALWGGCIINPVYAQREPVNISLHFGHPDIVIESVALDQDQQVYLASNHGFFVYNGRNLEECNWLIKKAQVCQLHIYGDTLFVGYVSGELDIVSLRSKSIVDHKIVADVPITKIEVAVDGAVFLGTAGRGIHLLNVDGKRDSVVSEMSDSYINDWHYDSQNERLVVATDRGVDQIKTNNNKLTYLSAVHPQQDLIQSINPLAQPQSKSLFAWSHAFGLVSLTEKEWTRCDLAIPYQANHGELINTLGHSWLIVNHREIYRISGNADQGWSAQTFYSADHTSIIEVTGLAEGYLMVWTENGSIHLIPATYSQLDQINGRALDGVSAICASSEGGVWVARHDSILELTNETGRPTLRRVIAVTLERDYPIVSLSENHHQLFAGSFGDGLFITDLDTDQAIKKLDEASGLYNNSILDIAHNKSKTWVSTMSGVHEVRLHPELSLTDLAGSPGYVYCLKTSPNGLLYVGSQGESMFVNSGNTLTHAVPGDTSSSSIISIQIDSAGRIWGLTTESKLFHFSEKGVIPHTLNKQLQSLAAYRLFLTPLGHLGLISEDALFDITPEGIAFELLGGPGLFESNFQHISAIDNQNNLWLARPDGVVIVENHALTSHYFPKTEIIAIIIDGESRTMADKSKLAHSVINLDFELKSVWHDPFRPVVREYRLLGLDTTWRALVDDDLHFAHLVPGSYNLELRTLFGPTLNPVHKTQYSFVIAPPYYFQWWFIILILSLLILALFIAIRYRERRLSATMALKTERIQTQFEVLKNQINPHFLFNSFNTLASLIPDDPKKAEMFTEKLSGYFREILTSQDRETNTLKRELELAEDFIFLQQSRYEESLIYSVEVNSDKLNCALPTLTLQILLENAIKHNQISKTAPLHIRVFTKHESLLVTNNLQPRLISPESTGIGLNNLSNRLQILSGKNLEIVQSDGIFKVSIPLVECD